MVVSFGDPKRLRFYQEQLRWPFPILADPSREVYSQFRLARLPWYRLYDWRTLKTYGRLLWKGRQLQDFGKDDIFQAGGDFLVDARGRILFAHRSHDPADRPSLENLQTAIEQSDQTAGPT